MIRTIYWYLYFTVSLIFKTFDLFTLKRKKQVLSPREFDQLAEQMTARWARSQIRNSGATLEMVGKENIPGDKAVLYVSNHQSDFDIAFFMADMRKPKGFIAKAEMLKVPLLRTWMKYINCVFIDRKDIRQSAQAIIQGINLLKEGHSLVLFPEGTRSKSARIGEFKAGSFKLATKSQAPIVPVTIDGSYKIKEANNNRIVPAKVRITIHKPIETATLTKEEQAQLPQTVKNIIESALTER